MREQYNPFIGDSNTIGASQLLPTNLKPTHYDIQLEPDLENATFDGSVIIHFDVLKTATFILLNSVNLDITKTEVLSNSGLTIIPKVHYNEDQQVVMIPLPEQVLAGSKIQLRQTFNGILNDSKTMSGFMRSSYTGFDGKSKWIGSTQGQATGMRQIFPCADEPALKATFSSTVVVDEGLTCLSNMDIKSQTTTSTRKKTVVFNKTPPMSTYLVAFVIGELNYIESNEFRVPVRVYATPELDITGGQFSLDVGARAMISHEKTFDLPYPLPKLDMIAIPGHSGGMENWGCVIYDDKRLVQDKDGISASDNITMAKVVIHELAHQWFGNIVTTAWWDSIWLNESFADWATCNAITHMFPEWESWSSFVAGHPTEGSLNAYQAALTLDSNRGSHPIEVPVSTPDQISQIFDAITYAKGCSVLRMISDYLGVDVFIKGVQLHLRKHAFGSATTNDLWNSLSIVSGEDVRAIMATWTQKVGYPMLSVVEVEDGKNIEISQHRFLQSGKMLPEDEALTYPIFLKTKSKYGIDEKAHLFKRKGTFPVDLNFYKLNAGQTGLYRVSYPLPRLEKLSSQLFLGLLSPTDRVGLLSDFSAMVASGHFSKARTSDLLTFLGKFRNEVNYFVWRQILVCFQQIRTAWMFEDDRTLKALLAFQTDLITPILQTLGDEVWTFKPSDDFNAQDFKAILFSHGAGYSKVRKVSASLFKRFIEGDSKILNPNIRKAIFELELSSPETDSSRYKAILATFRNSKSTSTKADALVSLSSATSPSLIAQTLKLANSSEIQGGNDRLRLLKGLQNHANGVEALWQWLKKDWESLIGGPASLLKGMVVGICVGGFSTFEKLTEVQAFFEGKDTKKCDKFLEQSLDEIRVKASWVERDREDVADWLKAHGYYEKCL